MIVKCPQCKVSYYETTDKYDPDVSPNGSMLRLRDPWRSMGWATYGLDRGEGPGLLWSDLECTGCSAPLAPSGRLIMGPNPNEDDNAQSIPSKAQRIQGLLEEGSLTQVEIAKMVNTSPQYVSNIARKIKDASMESSLGM